MKKFKRHRDYGFWDQDIRMSKLSQLGDPLEKLNSGIDFEIFRSLLEEKQTIEPKGIGGRPPYDYVLMFKVMILQCYYNLSEEQITNNREKSRIRSRVEHIFGFMEMSMNGMYINNIGIKRVTAVVGLMNLTYNMFRKIQLVSS